jgi:hypothetical protein
VLRLSVAAFSAVIAAGCPSPAAADPISGENYGLEDVHPDVKLRPNDRWATMRVTIDKKGRPTACKVIKSNLRRPEDRWLFCHGMMGWWRTKPVLKDGEPVVATVVTTLVDPSRKSRFEDDELKLRDKRAERARRRGD